MKKKDLSLVELIEEMKKLIHNNGRYCFSDLITDIQYLIEKTDICYKFEIFWCFRTNGTYIATSKKEVEDWKLSVKKENHSICLISFKDLGNTNKYCIKLLEEVNII